MNKLLDLDFMERPLDMQFENRGNELREVMLKQQHFQSIRYFSIGN